jgi:membrane glycosyltransferase
MEIVLTGRFINVLLSLLFLIGVVRLWRLRVYTRAELVGALILSIHSIVFCVYALVGVEWGWFPVADRDTLTIWTTALRSHSLSTWVGYTWALTIKP